MAIMKRVEIDSRKFRKRFYFLALDLLKKSSKSELYFFVYTWSTLLDDIMSCQNQNVVIEDCNRERVVKNFKVMMLDWEPETGDDSWLEEQHDVQGDFETVIFRGGIVRNELRTLVQPKLEWSQFHDTFWGDENFIRYRLTKDAKIYSSVAMPIAAGIEFEKYEDKKLEKQLHKKFKNREEYDKLLSLSSLGMTIFSVQKELELLMSEMEMDIDRIVKKAKRHLRKFKLQVSLLQNIVSSIKYMHEMEKRKFKIYSNLFTKEEEFTGVECYLAKLIFLKMRDEFLILMDDEKSEVKFLGSPVNISEISKKMLKFFLKNKGRIIPYKDIYENLTGCKSNLPNIDEEKLEQINSHIFNIHKEANNKLMECLEQVDGIGYKLSFKKGETYLLIEELPLTEFNALVDNPLLGTSKEKEEEEKYIMFTDKNADGMKLTESRYHDKKKDYESQAFNYKFIIDEINYTCFFSGREIKGKKKPVRPAWRALIYLLQIEKKSGETVNYKDIFKYVWPGKKYFEKYTYRTVEKWISLFRNYLDDGLQWFIIGQDGIEFVFQEIVDFRYCIFRRFKSTSDLHIITWSNIPIRDGPEI